MIAWEKANKGVGILVADARFPTEIMFRRDSERCGNVDITLLLYNSPHLYFFRGVLDQGERHMEPDQPGPRTFS